jgi:hypothetical protein
MSIQPCSASIGVDLRLWAEHGHGPLWLTFSGHSHYASAAFPADVLPSSYQGVSIPLPLSPGMLREEMIAELERAVASRMPGLAQARSAAHEDDDGLPASIPCDRRGRRRDGHDSEVGRVVGNRPLMSAITSRLRTRAASARAVWYAATYESTAYRRALCKVGGVRAIGR